MSMRCDYDDALPRFAALVVAHLGKQALLEHIFLRDSSGRITLVLRGQHQYPEDTLEALLREVRSELTPYVDSVPIATPSELFDPALDVEDIGHWERMGVAEASYDEEAADRNPMALLAGDAIRVLERRLVGQDWLTPPKSPIADAPPIVVFASLKGGVGRSTALAVAAADFAARGHNVLALDLDLEAPGLGSMLLPDDRCPTYGALDFFVENGLRLLDDEFFEDLYGTSPLTQGQGLVHVVPAVGRRCTTYPQNVLGKLARAYLEDPSPDGPKGFLAQVRDLITSMVRRHRYDVILVDTRAGLHESTAASILGLGADVLLFGIDTPQTFRGYAFILAHLARFATTHTSEDEDDWRSRFRFVHAKAVVNKERWLTFNDQAFELFADYLYDRDDDDLSEPFNFSLDAPEAPHHPWRVLSDSNYAEFDPPRRSEQLEEPSYARTFGDFLGKLYKRVFPHAS